MSVKHLPIQFFEKRKEFDERSTEGGGDGRTPSWVLSGVNLSDRSTKLMKNLEGVTRVFDTAQALGVKLPLVISTTICDEAIAKSHRSDIVSLYSNEGNSNAIGFQGDRCLLSMITNRTVITTMIDTLNDTKHQAKLISSITEINPFSPIIDSFDETSKYYKIRLINYNNYDFNNFAKTRFEEQCQEKDIKILRRTRYTKDITIYRVLLDSLEDMELLESFEGIYSVEKLTPVFATLDTLTIENPIPCKEPKPDSNYPTIGVLDTGIENIEHLAIWKTEISHTNYPEEYQDHRHGTFVSGIIEYGDELNGTNYTVLDGVKLFDAVVYPEKKDKLLPDELVEHVREAIEHHNEIKVWNLSLGTNIESSLTEFSDFGMALDNIQDENNVLIVKSTSNCYNFIKGLPKSRIAESADSLRSLVVGSLAKEQSQSDLASPDSPSPFTRVGPGPNGIIKPDLVFYGGNAGVKNGQPYITTGVPTLSIDGHITKQAGTSFSTPWVSRMAAELSYLVNDKFDPLFIRTLLIHNARYPNKCEMSMADKVNQMGYGMPISVSQMLYNSSDEATLVLRDTLDKGCFIEMFDFPYPQSLIDQNGFYFGQIIVTLAVKSLIDDKQASEYCQSNVDVLFGTYDTEKKRDVRKPTIRNPMGLEEPKNILVGSCYSSRVNGVYPKTGFEREYTLVKYGKFHPIKKYAIDLADFTASNRERYLNGTRKWYLKIEGLYRKFIEDDAILKDYQLSQEYCLILTIKDPSGKANIYDEITQQLEARNFVHHSIQLHNEAVVNIEEYD